MSEQAPPTAWTVRRRLRPPPPAGPCLNCGTPVDNRFCPGCGQRNAVRVISLRRMLAEAVEDQLSVNAALPRTMGALFFRPGHLTREYVSGRIARYIPPFRLYLVASLVFFIVLSFVVNADVIWTEATAEMRADSTLAARAGADSLERGDGPNLRMNLDTTTTSSLFLPLARRLQQQQDRINAMPAREALQLIVNGLVSTAPKVVFVLLPVFAAILKLLYVRKKRLYVEHFVFALHVHAFAFALATLALFLREGILTAVLFPLLLVYLFVAMKKVYAQGWLITAVKYVSLLFVYLFVAIFGVMAMVMLTLLTV
ncbi:MAG TPA: DUF3667 domain-containing protein [Longimicrobiaceae bacterium]|nr:DUF3667 domain-containing protein [Longimicrobiaceae bacterium]